jgi:serine/threonine protein kinase
MAASFQTERSARTSSLLEAALALTDRERATFIERETANDPSLRREMTALLSQLGRPGLPFDQRTTGLMPATPGPSLDPGTRIGDFLVLEVLGRGGMGEVYRAEHIERPGQIVALKLLRRDAVDHLDRFTAEREILSRLEHPGIARLHDAGIAADDRPFIVMELVPGMPITDWCRETLAPLSRRLSLFLQVCDAVAYAHQNLIAHRDLKPANILVTCEGHVKLLDFGVASSLVEGGDEAARETPLSLSYAAPEQLTQGSVTTATDVYALGVLLFELLAGRLPWETDRLPLPIAIGKLLHEVAPLVSRVETAAPRPVPVREITGDLDAIVAKALSKECGARYQTVAELAQEIRRYQLRQSALARGGFVRRMLGRWF